MVETGEGRLVTFEGTNRILLYPGAWPFSRPPLPYPGPAGLGMAPRNGGAEAALLLADGRLALFSERLEAGGGLAAWCREPGGTWYGWSYRPARGFSPTAACRLPDGGLLVLERRLGLLSGWGARIVRLAEADIAPGRLVAGEELARLGGSLPRDNFEGIAAYRDEQGSTIVLILSDDNFLRFQRSLLLRFRLGQGGE
jgi:hypothetical protein